MQLHVNLKKWSFKFKLLYPRNYISYFNKICRVNTHVQTSESLAQIRTTMAEIQHFILGDCFFIGASCMLLYCNNNCKHTGTIFKCYKMYSKLVLYIYLKTVFCTNNTVVEPFTTTTKMAVQYKQKMNTLFLFLYIFLRRRRWTLWRCMTLWGCMTRVRSWCNTTFCNEQLQSVHLPFKSISVTNFTLLHHCRKERL